jgi:fatty acid synthase subunit alpha, fungi type
VFYQQVAIEVSTDADQWISATILRDEFAHEQTIIDAVDTTADLENQEEANIELAARFLAFAAAKVGQKPDCKHALVPVLLNIFKFFTSSYLSTRDVHTLASQFDSEVRKAVLSAYFQALAVLREEKVQDIPAGPQSALLTAAASGKASVFAVFGGQGTNEVYFDELQTLYETYKPFVASFLEAITNEILVPLAAENEETSFYAHGLDVYAWLSGSIERPPVAYLASVPISLPVIGLTQLAQYLVVCHVAGITPDEMRSRLGGATGHSQGIVSAVVVSASSTFESFLQNSKKALRWLFWSGMRGQEAFPVVALEPTMVQDAIEGGEGIPSPMLSVAGLELKNLEPHVKKTNAHLPANAKIAISLHNGPRAFVVTGPAKSLYGLVTNLRKVKAPSGVDQSKVPFSQRKPKFSTRFLVVSVPYHSDYLEDTTEDVVDDLGEELWSKENLKIPVYHTESGKSCSFYVYLRANECDLLTRAVTQGMTCVPLRSRSRGRSVIKLTRSTSIGPRQLPSPKLRPMRSTLVPVP